MKRYIAALAAAAALAVLPMTQASSAPREADLVVSSLTFTPMGGHDAYNVYIWDFHDDPNYSSDYCDIHEGLVSSPGVHKLLTFSAGSTNVGTADLRIGNPASHKDWFVYSSCHGHYHFDSYALYRLLDANGNEVATSSKVGFCIIDLFAPDPRPPDTRQRYPDCDRQGLSVGWSDVYVSTVHGQWIEIDGVPPGDYTVEVTVNWQHVLPESDYTNNTATFPVTIP
jgi:hypothetical protein